MQNKRKEQPKSEGEELFDALGGRRPDIEREENGEEKEEKENNMPLPSPREPANTRLHVVLKPSQKRFVEKLAEEQEVSQGTIIRYFIEYCRQFVVEPRQ